MSQYVKTSEDIPGFNQVTSRVIKGSNNNKLESKKAGSNPLAGGTSGTIWNFPDALKAPVHGSS